MLRLCRVGYMTIKGGQFSSFPKLGSCYDLTRKQQKTILQRFYCKKSDRSQNDILKEVKTSTECPTQPVFPINPYLVTTQSSSSIKQCKTPNLYDEVPNPGQPWNPAVAAVDSKNRKILFIGIIIFLTSVLVVYYIIDFDKKSTKKALVDVDNKICKDNKSIVEKNPKSANLIPSSIPYLLIGGGTASFSAFRAIKSTDPLAKVLVVSNEGFHPYMRPPLSKEMWYTDDEELNKKLAFKQWNGAERSLFYEPPDFYMKCQEITTNEKGGIAIAKGWKVESIDVENRKVTLDGGHVIEYEKCLIATGAKPKNMEIFTKTSEEIGQHVTTYRDICDYKKLRELVQKVKSIAIIGGGFLGSELACSLARFSKRHNGATIYQVFKEDGNLGKFLPHYLSKWTTSKVEEEGVQVKANKSIIDANVNSEDKLVLKLSEDENLTVDHAVVAIGVVPNTDLAEPAGLEVDPELGGYLVNTELQARSNLYIAGDCACFYDPRLGRRRVEHHDHAVVTGRLAGENMTGANKPYLHQSMYWSDLGPDVGFEAIGIISDKYPTVGVFAKCDPKDAAKENEAQMAASVSNSEECAPTKESYKEEPIENFGKGVIFYLKNDVIVGILLWNIFNRMQVARQVLKEERKYEDLNEVAKLFNIHEE